MFANTVAKETSPEDFLLSSYFYDLPPELIAQEPAGRREDSRLLVLKIFPDNSFSLTDSCFEKLPEFLPPGALFVANNTQVLPLRVYAKKATGAKITFLPLTPLPLIDNTAEAQNGENTAVIQCIVNPARKIKIGEEVDIYTGSGNYLKVTPLNKFSFGVFKARLRWKGSLQEIFEKIGEIPLPPYIRRPCNKSDAIRYQTIFASRPGAMAAPTAGLHFSREMKADLMSKGFNWAEITLHVGYGTFSPVRCEDIRNHKMHEEYVEISALAADEINKAGESSIIAVGTTSLRALEGIYAKYGRIKAAAGWTDIFLYPGKKIHVANGLLTNFHLPESTLLMLVSAITGRKTALAAYAYAIKNQYRFFSYGDAMLIIKSE